MNFSAEKASRKWPCGALWPHAQRQWLPLPRSCWCFARQSSPAAAAQGRRRHPGATCSGRAGRSCAEPCSPAPCRCRRPRPAEAPRNPTGRQPRSPGPNSPRPTSRRPPVPTRPPNSAAAAALGLPAGADGGDRDRPQHPRHQGRRRLRRRGPGAAGGRGAAGQAAGLGEAGGDPALRHGVGDRRLDPHRHGAAGGKPRQHRSAISTISTPSSAAAATAWSAPGCPSTAAPTRSTFAPSSSPTASRSR